MFDQFKMSFLLLFELTLIGSVPSEMSGIIPAGIKANARVLLMHRRGKYKFRGPRTAPGTCLLSGMGQGSKTESLVGLGDEGSVIYRHHF